ncbi:hypothetical protein KIW84_063878 [Lathyrus oleraceus]|uniref:Retroviral polymerase SH3-like domain-containing protein n=1 Tax=Pisum sativum TaxID=3888 RepID=A0A9D4W8S0_PEA|nr:hypothetical protein KIW84_063878 [Pisum sativum]
MVYGRFRGIKALTSRGLITRVKDLILVLSCLEYMLYYLSWPEFGSFEFHSSWLNFGKINLDGDTPYRIWSGEHADYDRLNFFGCTSYYHVKDNKLDNRAKKVIFLGYAKGFKGYLLWSLEDSKFAMSRDVSFDEKSMVSNDGDVKISNKVVEIESTDQPESSHVLVGYPDVTHNEEDDEFDHEEVQKENTYTLQQ